MADVSAGMLSTRAWAFTFAGALLLTMLLASLGRFLEGKTVDRSAFQLPAMLTFFALFLVMGFSGLALMVRVFVAAQGRIGHGSHPIVRFLATHDTGVILALFALCAAGLALAVPAAIDDGFFGTEAKRWFARAVRGGSAGALVANVGMSLDDVRRRSTVKIPDGIRTADGTRTLIGEMVFDFEIADTGMRFPEARYFFMTTRPHDDVRIESMNVGISTEALARAEFDAFRRRVQERFRADGWVSGRFVYRTEAQRALHGGLTSSGEGSYWLKGPALVAFEPKRIDDEQRGEDPRTAGRWILALSISDRETSSTYRSLEFAPARGN